MNSTRRLVAALALVVALASSTTAHSAPIGEYPVKAAFLFNFAKFVTWPDEAFAAEDASLEICVVGRDPFGPALEETIGERTVRGRDVRVRRPESIDEADGCHVVFIAAGERSASLALRLGDRPALTVGESEGFAADGGMINFKIEESRVRFEINPGRAARAGLKVSAQLLNLATVVDGPGSGGE